MEITKLLDRALIIIDAIMKHPDATTDQLRDLGFVENDLFLMLQELQEKPSNIVPFRRRA